MSTVISKICSMPKDFYQNKNKSMSQLFNETGYFKEIEAVSKEAIVAHLRENPELITQWENYSSDKRVGQGWYLLENETGWIVGYASVPSQEQKRVYQSKFEACAEFILHELKEFAEHATRC